jgi:hypothetical protein
MPLGQLRVRGKGSQGGKDLAAILEHFFLGALVLGIEANHDREGLSLLGRSTQINGAQLSLHLAACGALGWEGGEGLFGGLRHGHFAVQPREILFRRGLDRVLGHGDLALDARSRWGRRRLGRRVLSHRNVACEAGEVLLFGRGRRGLGSADLST